MQFLLDYTCMALEQPSLVNICWEGLPGRMKVVLSRIQRILIIVNADWLFSWHTSDL